MQLTNKHITNNKTQITNLRGDTYETLSNKSTLTGMCDALQKCIAHADEDHFTSELHLTGCSLSKDSWLQINNTSHLWDNQITVSQPKADEPLAQKRSSIMEKHQAVNVNSKNKNSQITLNTTVSKRSNVMNATNLFSRALVVIISIFFMAAIAVGQNLNLLGAATIGGTVNVKGDINNASSTGLNTFTGTVQLKGTSAQSVGYSSSSNAINFATLTATGASAKTIFVPTSVTTTINVAVGTTGQFILAASKAMTIAGTITNTGAAAAPYLFSNAGSTVYYGGGAQIVWGAATPVTYDNLVVSTGGTKTLGGNVTAASALNVGAGNLSIGANTLYVNGTYSTTGTVTGGASSDMILGGSGSLATFAVTNGLGNLTLNRGGNTVTLSSGMTIGTLLTLSNGTLSLPASQALTLNGSGTVISIASGALTTVSGSVVSYASNAQNVYAMNYNDLSFGSGVKTFPAGSVGIAGNLTTGTATFDVTTNSNTVNFNGASQNIPAFTFYNLTISGTGIFAATGAITVNTTFVNNTGLTLNMGTQSLALGSSTTNNGTVQFGGAANGLLIATGTVEYNGGITQTIAGHALNTYTNLIFSGAGSKLITLAAGKVHTLGSLSTTVNLQVGANSGETTAELDADGDFTVGSSAAITNYGVINVGS